MDELEQAAYDFMNLPRNDNDRWLSFWEALGKSKEEDIIEAENWYGRILNNGDNTFLWEDTDEFVVLSGEHLGTRWRIVI